MGYRLDGVESDGTRSDLETLFLTLCARCDFPRPEVNVKLGAWEVDFLWRSHDLVVETDLWSYHRGSVAFEDDHARDLDLRAAGYTVLRFTDRQRRGKRGGWRQSSQRRWPANGAGGVPGASSRAAASGLTGSGRVG